jgi:hypothetical protein
MANQQKDCTKKTSKSRVKHHPMWKRRPQVQEDLKQFLSFKHTDPHQLLGMHNNGNQQIIRVFRPDAKKLK